jgi:hypothetical protein
VQYYCKELGFKVDKGELEAFRQDFVDRMVSFESKISERNAAMALFGEELEGKVESQLIEFRH